MRVPRGTTESDFKKALQEFANVVGSQWVFTSDEDVATYRDAYSPFVGQPEKMNVAGAGVSPTTVEEVQQIVRIANRYKVPLYTFSTGRNLGYGGSSPTFTGCVIVDLKRMNKVVEVNETEAYMIVEPGISFIEMHRHLQSIGSNLRLSAPQPGWGSPIGNAVDHGHGAASFNGDNFSMVKGLEVVTPTGELLRTGCGAVPKSKLWMHYEYGFGPYINGIFTQSNFGIVTKACFWLTTTCSATSTRCCRCATRVSFTAGASPAPSANRARTTMAGDRTAQRKCTNCCISRTAAACSSGMTSGARPTSPRVAAWVTCAAPLRWYRRNSTMHASA
jgi:(+)-pinoresinol hydroxylase